MPERKEEAEQELYLLERSRRGLLRMIFGRTGIVLLLLLLQLGVGFGLYRYLDTHLPAAVSIMSGFAAVMGIYVLNTDAEPNMKITWLGIILFLPVFGVLLYLYIQNDVGHRAVKARVEEVMALTVDRIDDGKEVLEGVKNNSELYQLAGYVGKTGCYPLYQNTAVRYFGSGEEKFRELLLRLEAAERFIFLEYFIVAEGHMWGRILEILARKAAQGVEVRLMYDGTCEFTNLPHNYPSQVEKLGIKCKQFAPIMPFLSTYYNYRDHRKIAVIDGYTAFTGGVNLADEYINRKKRFGHWKDSAVMLQGGAVRSFTLMFLQMWHVDQQGPNDFSWLQGPIPVPEGAGGYVLPYGDCPLDDHRVGEMVYIDILNRAQKYVYITTPYLILDREMEAALCFAAARGVEVKILLPGVPDKRTAYSLARTHYAALLKAGVEIYEYTPGFLHAKNVVSDDRKAVVGTINLDYRSFYHHFECAVYLYDAPAVMDVKRDVENMLPSCRAVTLESLRKEKPGVMLLGKCLKIFAPLM